MYKGLCLTDFVHGTSRETIDNWPDLSELTFDELLAKLKELPLDNFNQCSLILNRYFKKGEDYSVYLVKELLERSSEDEISELLAGFGNNPVFALALTYIIMSLSSYHDCPLSPIILSFMCDRDQYGDKIPLFFALATVMITRFTDIRELFTDYFSGIVQDLARETREHFNELRDFAVPFWNIYTKLLILNSCSDITMQIVHFTDTFAHHLFHTLLSGDYCQDKIITLFQIYRLMQLLDKPNKNDYLHLLASQDQDSLTYVIAHLDFVDEPEGIFFAMSDRILPLLESVDEYEVEMTLRALVYLSGCECRNQLIECLCNENVFSMITQQAIDSPICIREPALTLCADVGTLEEHYRDFLCDNFSLVVEALGMTSYILDPAIINFLMHLIATDINAALHLFEESIEDMICFLEDKLDEAEDEDDIGPVQELLIILNAMIANADYNPSAITSEEMTNENSDE